MPWCWTWANCGPWECFCRPVRIHRSASPQPVVSTGRDENLGEKQGGCKTGSHSAQVGSVGDWLFSFHDRDSIKQKSHDSQSTQLQWRNRVCQRLHIRVWKLPPQRQTKIGAFEAVNCSGSSNDGYG